MKKFILIILIILGVLIMLKPVSAIIKDSIGNIMFRGNVVTGIVATDNGDKSYDCYISESDVAYPKIFTLSANPNLAVGDKVRILYKGGCKELPIILPPTTAAAGVTHYIYVAWEDSSYDNWIYQYSDAGVLLNTWEVESMENIGNPMAVDVSDNVYYISSNQHTIYKRNSNGVLTLTKTETNYIYGIVAGADGFIYTYEYDSSFNNGYISKRNVTDLVSIGTKTVDAGGVHTYYGMTIDSSGRIYMVNATHKRYETWDYSLGLIAESETPIEYLFASLAVIDYRLFNIDWDGGGHGILLPKDYSSGETGFPFADISRPYNLGTKGDYCLLIGIEPFTLLIGKYDISGTKIWTTAVTTSYSMSCGIAAYPF